MTVTIKNAVAFANAEHADMAYDILSAWKDKMVAGKARDGFVLAIESLEHRRDDTGTQSIGFVLTFEKAA